MIEPLDLDALEARLPGGVVASLTTIQILRDLIAELRARRAEVADLKDRLCDALSQVRALARGVARLEVKP